MLTIGGTIVRQRESWRLGQGSSLSLEGYMTFRRAVMCVVVQLLGAGPHATQVCLTSFPRSPLKHTSSCCTLAMCH